MQRLEEAIDIAKNLQNHIETQNIDNHLLYISPEETGRLNLISDFRSDFYVIGIFIYRVFACEFPFVHDDDMQLIYAHTSMTAQPLISLDDSIPIMLSKLVEKLLSKNPKDRHKSLSSIIHDLELIIENRLNIFDLASRDNESTLEISNKIYDREEQAKTLISQIRKSTKELTVISGYSGVGKSSLITKVRNEIYDENIYFVQEKFEQQQSTQVFNAISQAISKYIKSIVTHDTQKIDKLVYELHQELGENIQLMLDYIHELSLIVSTKYTLKQLEPSKAQSRFNITFLKFMKIITRYSKKIILVIDDMQWCDLATINLIELMINDDDLENISFILAYRNNEVKSTHPFSIMLSKFISSKNYTNLELLPLDKRNIVLLLEDTLGIKNLDINEFAQILKDKTDGNPFFIKTILSNLYHDGYINYFVDTKSWYLNLAEIKKINISSNIVDSVTKRIDKLDEEAKNIFSYASVMGSSFYVKDLSAILELDIEKLNMIFDDYKEFVIKKNTNEYIFAHDKVQEAFSFYLDDRQKELFHHKAGRYLIDTVSNEYKDIFVITKHLNSAKSFIHTPKDKFELLELNQKCANKLINLNSYENAIFYFKKAIELQGENRWDDDYDRSIYLFTLLTEVYYLNLEFEKSKEKFLYILAHAKNLNDKIKITQVEIFSLIAQNKSKEALELGQGILSEYGIELPNEDDFSKYYPKLFELYDTDDVQAIKTLPQMTSKEMLNIVDILNSMMAPAYQTAPHLYPKICYVAIDMCLRYGNSAASTNAYAVHGLLLSAFFSEFKQAKEFAKLSQNLIDIYDGKAYIAKINMIANACVNHWSSELSSTLEELKETIIAGVEVGDFEYACYNKLYYTMNLLLSGENLQNMQNEFKEQVKLMHGLRQTYQLLYSSVWEELISNLTTLKDDPITLEGYRFSEKKDLKILTDTNSISILYNFYYSKAFLALVYEDIDLAYKFILEAKTYHFGVASLYQFGEFAFYESIITYRYYKLNSNLKKDEVMSLIDNAINYYDSLCESAPQNNLHKKDMLIALLLELKGDSSSWTYLDKASKNAKKYKFTHILGLIYQYAFYYWQDEDMEDFTQTYLLKTYATYSIWGAKGVCKHLMQTYPNILNSYENINDSIEKFDLKSVLKISQSLSQELEIDELLKIIINIIIENSSSQTGYLFFQKDDELELFASYTDGFFSKTQDKLMLPLQLIKYVKKTKKDINLRDENRQEIIQIDKYLLKNTPKSMYCSNILYKGEFRGILYIENKDIKNIYTQERVEVLQLLLNQASTSMENAKLFDEISKLNITLENKVAKRTNELQKVIIDLENTQKDLKYLADTDSMTKLYNRRYFSVVYENIFSLARRDRTKLSILMLDIDLFKSINDMYGHKTGDEVIVAFANKIMNLSRESDVVCRFGGEEFLILLPNTNIDGAEQIAQKIRKETLKISISVDEVANKSELHFSVSIGVSEVDLNLDEHLQSAVVKADKALYEAKESGRNLVCTYK